MEIEIFTAYDVYICPKGRLIDWESVVTFSSPSLKSFSFTVEGGRTMEIIVAQSSGNRSHTTTYVDLEVILFKLKIVAFTSCFFF